MHRPAYGSLLLKVVYGKMFIAKPITAGNPGCKKAVIEGEKIKRIDFSPFLILLNLLLS